MNAASRLALKLFMSSLWLNSMKKLIVLCLFCSPVFVVAQSLNYGGVFPTIDYSGELTAKLGYGFYYFAAFPLVNLDKTDLRKNANFLLFYSEQSFTYNVNKQLSFTGSYVFQRANVVNDNSVNENRFYVQTKYKHSIKQLNLTHRIRWDGRFVENRHTKSTPFTHRARYLFGFDFPIKTKKDNLYFTVYEELFFSTVSGANLVYEENWACAAFGIKLNENNKIEPGILYITWSIGKPNWFNQYYFQLSWISHLSLNRKKE